MPPRTSYRCIAAWTAKDHEPPIAIDGTNRHEASYMHCTIGGTTSPNKLASWWLIRVVEHDLCASVTGGFGPRGR